MERLDMAQKRADGVLSYPEDLFLHIAHFDDLMRQYQEAAKAITTKLEDFQVDLISHNGRSCIETITFRSKTPSSIEAMRTQLDDIAGIRVICPFRMMSIWPLMRWQEKMTSKSLLSRIISPAQSQTDIAAII